MSQMFPSHPILLKKGFVQFSAISKGMHKYFLNKRVSDARMLSKVILSPSSAIRFSF